MCYGPQRSLAAFPLLIISKINVIFFGVPNSNIDVYFARAQIFSDQIGVAQFL